MRLKRRAMAALTIAALAAPGTWLRSPASWDPPSRVDQAQVSGPRATSEAAWRVEGVWHYTAPSSLLFGGYSALLALPDGTLQAFSDRGARFTFAEPDGAGGLRTVVRQRLDPPLDYVDAEAATRDPASGRYWIALENRHGIYRFGSDNRATGVLRIDGEALGWGDNSGIEAMARLADGRFVALPEGSSTGLIFADDPIENPEYRTFEYEPPVQGHGATDMAQLPDGRVLLLLRNLDPAGGLPPFESKIAIGPAPAAGQRWAPRIALDLAGVLPRENYEGLAIRPRADGSVTVWLIADDNMSVMQRTLVAKLRFDPAIAPN